MNIRKKSFSVRAVTTAVALAMASILVVSCAQDPGIAGEWGSGGDQNYISGDGSLLEIAPASRVEAPAFSGPLDLGGELDSAELQGDVSVINFWYAGCPPCRVEAADLEATYQEFKDDGVKFVGVNVRDTVETARSFSATYDISYPSIMDIETASAQLAFAGVIPPNAVPTTLVLDREGRVSARVLGIIEAGTLRALINSVLAEEPGQ